ncbi:MAG: hypothetical protein EZS28_037935 [Streblomastix strix]|uniref:Tyr recombinase domain-containing protein n=1 Tax=Streblomastix strix TaxID=222440 RepID=A0A5J4U810_9EUKA|nr:MAG: hypothetical protein EZS28_037935 [Streblomastix strix]
MILLFIGHPNYNIHTPAVQQLMKKIEERTRKVQKEEEIWDLSVLTTYIISLFKEKKKLKQEQKIAVVIILVMIYSNLRLTEVQRASIDSTQISQGKIIISTVTKKGPAGPVIITLNRMKQKELCPIEWFTNLDKREQLIAKDKVWIKNDKYETYSTDRLSIFVRKTMKEAGIEENQRVTTIRAAAITKAIQKGATSEEVNRWSRHANTADTIQRYYDKGNNRNIRNMFGNL